MVIGQIKPLWGVWAEGVSAEISESAKKKGSRRKGVQFASKARLEGSQWRHIRAGDSMVSDDEAYARVYYELGIKAADPRTFPILPSGRHKPWTEQEYQNWLTRHVSSKGEQILTTQKGNRQDSKYISTEESQVFKEDRLRWCIAARDEVIAYCTEQNYSARTKLREQEGLSESAWRCLMAARFVSNTKEIYAQLSVRISSRVFDPRTIPPQILNVPSSPGMFRVVQDAWTDTQFDRWLRRRGSSLMAMEARFLGEEVAKPISASFVSKERERVEAQPTLGMVIDQALESLTSLPQVFQEILGAVEKVSAKVDTLSIEVPQDQERSETGSMQFDPEQLFDQLNKLLRTYVDDATPEERDVFAERYKVFIAEAYQYIGKLSLPFEQREEAITLQKEFAGG
jgi:hypothetical protein